MEWNVVRNDGIRYTEHDEEAIKRYLETGMVKCTDEYLLTTVEENFNRAVYQVISAKADVSGDEFYRHAHVKLVLMGIGRVYCVSFVLDSEFAFDDNYSAYIECYDYVSCDAL